MAKLEKLDKSTALFLDIQTTGVSPRYGQVLELGWLFSAPQSPRPVQAVLVQCPEGHDIPKKVQRITGISQQDLRGQKVLAEAWENIMQSLPGDQAIPTVIHYARFETMFLNGLDGWSQLEVFCSYEIAKRLLPDIPSVSLRGLMGYLGRPLEEKKRCFSHVEATYFLWQHLLQLLNILGICDWLSLRQWLEVTKRPRSFQKTYGLSRQVRLEIPPVPGIYHMKNAYGNIIYIGKATSLKSRVNSYFRGRKGKGSRLNEMLSQVVHVDWKECDSSFHAALEEHDAIKKFRPAYNIALKGLSREIGYLDKDLQWVTYYHAYGPYAHPRLLSPFLGLRELINKGNTEQKFPFYDEENLDQGVEAFCKIFDVLATWNFRQWRRLAMGLWRDQLVRRQQASMEIAEQEAGQEESMDNIIESEKEDIAELAGFVWDPESMSRFWQRNLISIVDSTVKGWFLQRLTNCSIYWQKKDCSGWHEMVLNRGSFIEVRLHENMPTYRPPIKTKMGTGAKLLGVDVFDRLTVVHAEIKRMLAQGRSIFIYDARGHFWNSKEIKNLMVSTGSW